MFHALPTESTLPMEAMPLVDPVSDFWDFAIWENWEEYYRNSYRYRKCHIYETVKLNQIELSNQFDYSESEKRFKAFTEHDLGWSLIAQSYFLWQRATAW